MAGIASATPEWLELYMELRLETEKRGETGTTDQLDDALARGLALNPEGILRLAGSHPQLPIVAICSRTAPLDQDPADVLDARGVLGIVRRERALERLEDKELDTARAKCLEATRALARRQLRIYLDSYGAADSAPAPGAPLPERERRELEAVLTAARRDTGLRARLDGHLPDGPFRIAQIPRVVLACCSDEARRISNPEGPWDFGDVMREDPLPRARLLNACKVSNESWDITFERGGLTTRHERVRARLAERRWEFTKIRPGRRQLSETTSIDDYWLDCHGLAAN